MSALASIATAVVLSCGLNATPDGQTAPDGDVVMMRSPLEGALLESLKSGAAPVAPISFTDADNHGEWIIGIKQDATRGLLLARLTSGALAYQIRIGWARQMDEGTYTFEETSTGSCRIEDAALASQDSSK